MANSTQQSPISLHFVSRAQLPMITRGAAKDSVTILDNGQIRFSKSCSEALGKDIEQVVVSYDTPSRTLYVIAVTPQNVKNMKISKDTPTWNLKCDKSGGYNFAATSLLKASEYLGELYDYKASGTQSLDATCYPAQSAVGFHMPVGALEKKQIAPRKPRTKKVNGAIVAGGNANGAIVAGDDEGLTLTV